MAAERSLERCGVDSFDLLLLHNPDHTGFTSPAVWDGLETLRAEYEVLEDNFGTRENGLFLDPIADPSAVATIKGVARLDDLEKEMVLRAMKAANGNKALAARMLGIPKTSLYNRMEKYGLDAKRSGTFDTP